MSFLINNCQTVGSVSCRWYDWRLIALAIGYGLNTKNQGKISAGTLNRTPWSSSKGKGRRMMWFPMTNGRLVMPVNEVSKKQPQCPSSQVNVGKSLEHTRELLWTPSPCPSPAAIHPFMRPLEWRNYVLLIPKEAVTDVTSLISVIKHLTRANSREICFMVEGMVHPIMQWRNRTVAR